VLSPLIRLRGERQRLQDQIEQLAKIAATTDRDGSQYASQVVSLTRMRDALAALDKRIERLEAQRRAP
jgi:BMFP domain-containing protein YqiC